MRKILVFLSGILLLGLGLNACAPRPEPLQRIPLTSSNEQSNAQAPTAYPAPEEQTDEAAPPPPDGMPLRETASQVLAQIVEILPPTHSQATHLVRLKVLSASALEGALPIPAAANEVIEAHTKEDLSNLKAGDTIQATLRYAGDEHGVGYWLVNVQLVAYP